jgi:hypothetical protein
VTGSSPALLRPSRAPGSRPGHRPLKGNPRSSRHAHARRDTARTSPATCQMPEPRPHSRRPRIPSPLHLSKDHPGTRKQAPAQTWNSRNFGPQHGNPAKPKRSRRTAYVERVAPRFKALSATLPSLPSYEPRLGRLRRVANQSKVLPSSIASGAWRAQVKYSFGTPRSSLPSEQPRAQLSSGRAAGKRRFRRRGTVARAAEGRRCGPELRELRT